MPSFFMALYWAPTSQNTSAAKSSSGFSLLFAFNVRNSVALQKWKLSNLLPFFKSSSRSSLSNGPSPRPIAHIDIGNYEAVQIACVSFSSSEMSPSVITRQMTCYFSPDCLYALTISIVFSIAGARVVGPLNWTNYSA